MPWMLQNAKIWGQGLIYTYHCCCVLFSPCPIHLLVGVCPHVPSVTAALPHPRLVPLVPVTSALSASQLHGSMVLIKENQCRWTKKWTAEFHKSQTDLCEERSTWSERQETGKKKTCKITCVSNISRGPTPNYWFYICSYNFCHLEPAQLLLFLNNLLLKLCVQIGLISVRESNAMVFWVRIQSLHVVQLLNVE